MQDAFERARSLRRELCAIPLRAIVVDPAMTARLFDWGESDADLERAVSMDGVQVPIVVDRQGDSSFRLLDGARRRAASLRAGNTHIPALVYDALPTGDALLVQYASQHAVRPLWDEREYSRMLRAVINAQLVAKTGARYASEYKWRILGLASDCTTRGELARLLRTEGLTHAHLAAWKRQFDESGSFEDRRGGKRTSERSRASVVSQPAAI